MGLAPHLSRRAARFTAFAALIAVCGFALLAISGSHSGEAAFPGANGRIAYSYGDAYTRAIWAANPDGTAPTMLTSGASDETPAYSADGSRIAFERNGGIAVMNANGGAVTQLVSRSGSTASETEWVEDYETAEQPPRVLPFVRIQTTTGKWHGFGSPSFSPDGAQLAVSEWKEETEFVSICAVAGDEDEECLEYGNPDAYTDYEFQCFECSVHIVTISSTSGAQTGVVTSPPVGNYDMRPAYSAGGKIAFERRTEFDSAIFVVASPGTPPVQVTSGSEDSAPDFSPDGSKIAYVRGNGDLALVGAGGGPVTILQTPKPAGAFSATVGAPSFSPDGTKISFERTIFNPGSWDYGVFTIGVDGSGITKILDKGFEPSWQPISLPPPPRAAKGKAKKGKIRLNGKGKATIATIVCGSSPCALKVKAAKLKAGKKKCSVGTKLAKRLAAGKSTPLGVRVAGKCLTGLEKAGKGKLLTKVGVVDGLGKTTLTFKSKLLPPKPKKGKK